MQKIGLLSDTHGFLDPKVFGYFEDCDQVWHAGDFGTIEVADQLADYKPLKGVYGNIDGQTIRQTFPLDTIFEVEGMKVWMTHIAGYPTRYNKRVREQLSTIKPDIVVCGHSHILKVQKDQKFGHLHLNPGAVGNKGFHKVRTLLKFTIDKGKIEGLQAIELHPRVERLTGQ